MTGPTDTALPATMKAIAIREPGEADVLDLIDLERPTPKAGEILVKIAAAAINRGDIIQRQGFYPPPPGAPDTPGLEAAGEVVATGPGTSRWKQGDKVMVLLAGGGYAEYCTVHESHALPVPEGFSMEEAGATPEAVFTVWTNIFEAGQLKAGETLLMHGGSSGIGSTAIQMAKIFGARVFATAGSAEKCRSCETFGADRAINYKEEDFVEVVQELTDKKGVDVIFDMVGGDYIQRNITAAARKGRIVNIAYQAGSVAEVNFLPIMLKRLVMTGSTLRARSIEEKAELTDAIREKVLPHLNTGRLRPVIYRTFPLAEAAEAHRLMESSQHIGKIVLIP